MHIAFALPFLCFGTLIFYVAIGGTAGMFSLSQKLTVLSTCTAPTQVSTVTLP